VPIKVSRCLKLHCCYPRAISLPVSPNIWIKWIPTETIASSVEAVLSRQRALSESAKDNIKSRIASTAQSASIPDNNFTKDEQQAPKRLKNDNNIAILPADKGRATVLMDKTDYFDKMDALVNDKQTYEELRRDPTPALQRKLNSKILTLKKTDAIDTQRYYRLKCSVPQPPKLYKLTKLHKPGIPMRPIVSFCGVSYVSTVQVLKTIPLTNLDANYNLRKTLLTLSKQYRYLTTTTCVFWCEVTVHQYSTSIGITVYRDRYTTIYS